MITSACLNNEKIFMASGYTSDDTNDVIVCSLGTDGKTEALTGMHAGDNPSFFTFGKEGLVYVVNEVDSFDLKAGGGITTLRFDKKTKSLTKIGSINQGGGGPCHITLSHDGQYLITANYGSGSVSLVKLSSEGIPEKVTDVIFYGDRSHPHMTLYNPRLHTYYVSDLGLDKVHQLKLDSDLGLLMNAVVPSFSSEPGSGPRHMSIDKAGANLYVINELNSTVSVYNILSDTVNVKQTVSTLPEGFGEKSFCADIHLSDNGKKIYGSNRGHNSIVTLKVRADGTLLSPTHQDCGGNWPRNFAVTGSGKYFLVANQRSNEISVLSGSSISEEVVSALPLNAPACVRFLK